MTTATTTAAAAGGGAAAAASTEAAAAKTLNALLHMPAQMEMSQIELIYRAEGNANLVLALPQFKKVLRLPKMISSRPTNQQQQQQPAQDSCQPEAEASVSDPTAQAKAGNVLTMPDFMAYIEIMRRLLGNEFVCAADIVAIPKESDRFWINEHIRNQRPVARLDKEFVGPFGLLLPDVTQLPATFDVLLANLQAKDMNTDKDADNSSGSGSSSCPGITRLGDTYAIEIKPKQGWLQLPSDVTDLFDLIPGDTTTTTTSDPAKVRPDKCCCRYCSMQQLKLLKGKIKRLGDYCPLQLFSGAPRRMLDALNALFACPQNNLRVFQSGNLIYGDHANSISCDELHTRVFPGEIMALIKHLLVACLLREYNNNKNSMENVHVAGAGSAFGESTAKRCGTKTKATETTEIVEANVDAAAWHVEGKLGAATEDGSGIVEFVKAVAGQPQPQRRATKAAVEKTSQRYTKRSKITETATTTTTIASTWLSTNVAMAATRTEMETETLTKAATTTVTTTRATSSQALISKAEIFHLPKNCVLEKILHLQLLVKRHFAYMWRAGYAEHATPTYRALRTLLSCRPELQDRVEELDAEQAYLLGATALDCSIMLTFQEIRCQERHNSSLQPWLVVVQGRQFLTKLSVLDLDPKPDSHFHKFIEHTRQIESAAEH